MIKQQVLVFLATLALGGKLAGCASDKGTASAPYDGAGGVIGSSGGAATGGTSGIVAASGGAYSTGGALSGSGGLASGTGGAQSGTGGAATTGGATATGGNSSGGTSATTGGSIATGGAGASTGGRVGTGGTSLATGGTVATGGASTGGTTAIDPSVSSAISACIDKLPYGGNKLSATDRAPIVTAIINACAAFAPPGAQWQTYCQMFLVAAINAESSYDTKAGTTGAGADPSVGLLQIRFSSVVRDFADYGPVDTLTRIGCDFGSVTSSDSYATKGSMMVDVACNVAIGAWYYFVFGSGNGGSTVVWVDQYCRGGGVAGNLHIGMASFLMGGEAAHSSLSGADYYYNEIKGWFDPCVTYTGTHPFELAIEPDTAKYCG